MNIRIHTQLNNHKRGSKCKEKIKNYVTLNLNCCIMVVTNFILKKIFKDEDSLYKRD